MTQLLVRILGARLKCSGDIALPFLGSKDKVIWILHRS